MTTNVTVFPTVSRPPGTYLLSSVTPPLGISSTKLSFDRSSWTNSNHLLEFNFELSFDSGSTWISGGGFTDIGGTIIAPNGSTLTGTFIFSKLPKPTDINTRIRGTLILSGGTFTTSGTLILE